MALASAVTMLATSMLVALLVSSATMAHLSNDTAGGIVRERRGVGQQCPAACPPCPVPIAPGYHQPVKGLGYYKMHRQWKTWHEAKATCEREGADLAVINSQEEADLLGKISLRHSAKNIFLYVGFFKYDAYSVTVLDQTLSSRGYVKWGPGEPKADGSCGMFFHTKGLYISNCSVPRQFICEI